MRRARGGLAFLRGPPALPWRSPIASASGACPRGLSVRTLHVPVLFRSATMIEASQVLPSEISMFYRSHGDL